MERQKRRPMFEFRFLPHTADISLELEADTPEELFQAALLGMNEVLQEGGCAENAAEVLKRPIRIAAIDRTVLLIDFLSSALTQSYLNGVMFCRLEILSLAEQYLDGILYGRPVGDFHDDIKAVTYHGADIRQEAGRWQTTIVFDI